MAIPFRTQRTATLLTILGLMFSSYALAAKEDKPDMSFHGRAAAAKPAPAPQPAANATDLPKLGFPVSAKTRPTRTTVHNPAPVFGSERQPVFYRPPAASGIPVRHRAPVEPAPRIFEQMGRTGSGPVPAPIRKGPAQTSAVSKIVVNDNWSLLPDSTVVSVGIHNYKIGRDAAGSIQRGIDLAAPNGKVDVLPGNYDESAPNSVLSGGEGPYQFGLFFSFAKGGLTLEGVDELGNVITSAAAAAATVKTNSTNNFGPVGCFVDGDGVTISGLIISTNSAGFQKTFEIAGDAFTLKHCQINDDEGSVYFNDWRYDGLNNISHIQTYTIESNTFQAGNSIDLTSGAGYTGPAAGRVIHGNAFHGVAGEPWAMVSFNGSNTGVPWFVYSVGGATITGNTFVNTEPLGVHIRARGTYDNSTFAWASYWNSNTYDRAVVVGASPPADLRTYSYPNSYGTFNDVRQIASAIQPEVDHGASGDKLLAKAGVYNEHVIVETPLTMLGANAGVCAANGGARGPETVIDGNSTDAALVILSDDVTVDGFQIVHGLNGSYNAGVWMSAANKGMTIKNNVVQGNTIGIYANCSDASEIACNLISFNNAEGPAGGTGIYSESTNKLNIHFNEITGHTANNPALFAALGAGAHTDLLFTDNNVHANDFGIYALSISGGTFMGNTVTTGGNATAITFDNACVGIDVKDNFLNDNARGVRIRDGGYGYGDNSDIEVTHNDLVNDADFGVGVLSGYSGPDVDATCNWWGDVTGPGGPANPTGLGSDAIGTSNIHPWRTGTIAGPALCDGTFPVKNLNTGLTYPTIQAAIDAPQTLDGHVIKAPANVYVENVYIDKKITLIGANAGTCAAHQPVPATESVIDGGLVGAAVVIVVDDVTIDGFTIRHGYNGSNAGVWMSALAKNMKIVNNIIRDNTIGIYANCADASQISCNLIFANNITPGASAGAGIYSEFTTKLKVDNNEITGHTENNPVIFALGGPNAHNDLTFDSNYLHTNEYGVFALAITGGAFTTNNISTHDATALSLGGGCSGIDVTGNILNNNARGVRVNDPYSVGDNSDITVTHNDLVSDTDFGVGVLGGYSGPGQLAATCNWWGDVTGPGGPANPTGLGSDAIGTTDIHPWLTGSIAGAPLCNGTFPVKNLNSGLTYPTIQQAIDAPETVKDDVIFAPANTYVENVVVDKGITLRGANHGECAANGGARVPESVIDGNQIDASVRITTDNVTIDGFKIVGGANNYNAGVYMTANTQNVSIRNNIITNNTIGIYANSNDASSISCNLVEANNIPGPSGGSGIYSENTNHLTIINNEFRNHPDNNPVIFAAVTAGDHKDLRFESNNVHDNGYGLYAVAIAGGTFTGNTATTGGGATALTLGGGCSNINVTNNVMNNNLRGVRVQLDYFTDNIDVVVSHNDFVNDTNFGVGVLSGYLGDVMAECNWYGSASGPTNGGNPGGTGSAVVGTSDFHPWLVGPIGSSPACSGTVGGSTAEMIFPNGGETFHVGFDIKIVWNANIVGGGVPFGKVALEYSRDYGAHWTPISNAEAPGGNTDNDGSLTWTVNGPGTYEAGAPVYSGKIRVVGIDDGHNQVIDEVDAPFAVEGAITGIGDGPAPTQFGLSAAWPTPSTGRVNLEFAVAKDAHVKLSVLDLQGRVVAGLADGEYAPGRYKMTWDGRSGNGPAVPGLYFAQLETPNKKFVQRIVIER